MNLQSISSIQWVMSFIMGYEKNTRFIPMINFPELYFKKTCSQWQNFKVKSRTINYIRMLHDEFREMCRVYICFILGSSQQKTWYMGPENGNSHHWQFPHETLSLNSTGDLPAFQNSCFLDDFQLTDLFPLPLLFGSRLN